MPKLNKKVAAGVAAAVIVAAGAGTAYAYWTTTGSGSGSATNGTANGTIVLHAAFAGGLTPGASEDVTYTADNLNSSSLYVGTVSATVGIDAAHSDCSAADFVVPALTANKTVPTGPSGVGYALGTGSITFTDTSANQDACKGAVVTLTLASS